MGDVVTDITGVSARSMLAALIAGVSDSQQLAELARGRLRAKYDQLLKALHGRFTTHHAVMLTEQLGYLDYLDGAVARLTAAIEQRVAAAQAEIDLLDTIPGINPRTAVMLLAEIGADMTRFPSARHLASWAGICPGNNESAGKHYSGQTRKGDKWLRQALMEAAHGAARTKNTYLTQVATFAGDLKRPWSSVTVTGLQTKTENGELHGHQHCTRLLPVRRLVEMATSPR